MRKLNVVIFGKMPIPRKECEEFLTLCGYNVQENVIETTDMLITDDVNSKSSKMLKAKKYGVDIILFHEIIMRAN